MATHDPYDRDPVPPTPPGPTGGPEDPVVYPAEQDRRSYAGDTPDDAHRRAAFGRRPSDVPASYVPGNRRRSSVLPWVLGLLLLVALLPLAGHLRKREQTAPWGSDTATAAAGGEVNRDLGAPAGAKQRFVEWTERGGEDATALESEENHPYTSQGIRLLADALAESAQGSKVADARQRIDDLRVQADRLQSSPGEDKHSEYAHAAFASAAKLLNELRAGKQTASSSADDLTKAAEAVDPTKPLSPQGPAVRKFFRLVAKSM